LKASGGPKFLPPAINQPRDNIHPPSDSKNRCARREGLCDDRVTALRLDRQEHQRSLQASVADLKPKLLALDPLVHLHAIDENIAELAALPSHRCCAAGGPLGHDPQRAAEPFLLPASPQLRAIVMTGGPLHVESVKMGSERTLAASKDVLAPTAQHVADEAAAMSGATHNLLNGGAVMTQCENGGVGLLTA
jgi:hypothetical protein